VEWIKFHFNTNGASSQIEVKQPGQFQKGINRIPFNGEQQEDSSIPIKKDGKPRHDLIVIRAGYRTFLNKVPRIGLFLI